MTFLAFLLDILIFPSLLIVNFSMFVHDESTRKETRRKERDEVKKKVNIFLSQHCTYQKLNLISLILCCKRNLYVNIEPVGSTTVS